MKIRPATLDDPDGLARVHIDTWRAAYRGIVPDAVLDGLSYPARAERWREILLRTTGATITLVAEDAGQVVGFAGAGSMREGPDGYDGELWALYVQPEYQGRGLGRQLTVAAAEWLHAAGYRSMLVLVLADNPSRHFYERLGGRYVGEASINIGGADLREAAYGWDNLAAWLDDEAQRDGSGE